MRPSIAALLALGLSACAGGRHCPAPEIFAPVALDAWDGGRLDVDVVARAPSSCPGARHPILRASHPKAADWVHLVELDDEVFVDVSKADRAAGVPFYTQKAQFWDNPGWTRPTRRPLVWTGWARLRPALRGFTRYAFAD